MIESSTVRLKEAGLKNVYTSLKYKRRKVNLNY